MGDLQLLRLAAKAAGIPAYWSDDGTIQKRPVLVVKAGGCMGTMPYEAEWNPLRDNDTAFKLAVKLRMSLFRDGPKVVARARLDLGGIVECSVPTDGGLDEFAATRRAITEVAASIGAGAEGDAP